MKKRKNILLGLLTVILLATAVFAGDIEIKINGATDAFTIDKSDNTEAMRVTADGKVGIGTNTPTEKLDVAGKIKTTEGVHFVGNLRTQSKAMYDRMSTTILDRTYSPKWLSNHATFGPSRSTTFADNKLSVAAGSVNYENILEFPLVAAGELNNATDYLVTINLSSEKLTTDNDLTFGLTDGIKVVSFIMADAGNNQFGWIYSFNYNSNVLTTQASHASAQVGSTPVRRGEIQITLSAATGATIFGVNTEAPASADLPFVLDRSKELKLIVIGNNASELYDIFAISAKIEEQSL